MDLIERLRPRWRHPDPEVRAAAVREMGADDHERLASLARTDPDARVRRAAIKRLDDAALLEQVAASETDPALRDLAAERLRETLVAIATSNRPVDECGAALGRLTDERSFVVVATSASAAGVRREALGRITSERALRDVVRHATDAAIQREALDRIHDAAALRSIAAGDGPADIALRALERIDDAGTLRAIAESRTAGRSVRERARARLSSDTPPVGLKEARARQLALCTVVGKLTTESDVLRAAERVREVQREWLDLARDVPPRDDVAARFDATCEHILEEAASLERRMTATEHAAHAREENLAARRALCEQVAALDGADALRSLRAVRAAWNRLDAVSDESGAELSRRFAQACAECASRHQRWLADEARHTEVEAAVEEAEALAAASPLPKVKVWKEVEKQWESLAASRVALTSSAALEARFVSAGTALRRRWREADDERASHQQGNLAHLAALCARLEELAGSEALKPSAARRELQAADAALANLGPLPPSERRATWTERVAEGRDRLLRRVRREEETEEWRRWANVGAQEEIIQRVEALLEANDLAEGTRQLGQLQDEWARVATASPEKSQALWERFRTVRNELRKRCDAYLADNLEKKRSLCAQLAGLADSTAWNETAEAIKRLQAEWKTIGPVPGKYSAALWQQFREPCDRFFARRKEHFDRLDGERREHVQRKTALCEQAEAFAESTDWEATAAVMKRLQAEWKQSGPLPRAQSEALWQRFRASCDRFFDRRNRREDVAREAALQRAEALCSDLEATVAGLQSDAGATPDEVGRKVDETWAEWIRLDVATADGGRAAGERIRAAYERIAALRPESLRGTRLDPDVTRKRREKLCARLEQLLGTNAAPAREMSLQEKALALRDRLAANTIGGGSGSQATRQQDTAREVERISATWAHLGPALDADARALAERFERARARASSA
jgi:hypothetical protein